MTFQKIVHKINRRRSLLVTLDKYAGWGIGLGIIAAYGCIHGLGA